MLGSYAEAEDALQEALARAWQARESFRGDSSLRRWLYTIATNTCLNALTSRRARSLPELEGPASVDFGLPEPDPERFITLAADSRLFPDAEEQAETRESVTLAFVALLQRVPPRQRAALLMKDVLGWSAEEIAEALELSLPSVNSALHRAREAVKRSESRHEEPPPETLRGFVRAWEMRDLDTLVALLRDDVTLSMPPWPLWVQGAGRVVQFFRLPRFDTFWAPGVRLLVTRANGRPALAFYRRGENGVWAAHSVMVARFVDGRAAELTAFIGVSSPEQLDLPANLGGQVDG